MGEQDDREPSTTLPAWTWRAGLDRAECPALEGQTAPEGIER